ncbi:MAG: LPS export ABC transporter permease LptG [Acidiferrobacteraceae bacterium]|nr:LPS export ABC transporter permease LptG [Acidiferrobacteraceae bacterium]
MRILDRYIGGVIVRQSCLVFLVLVGLSLSMIFIEELALVGSANYTLGSVLRFVALSVPRITYDMFPMIALIGAILGLSSLASGSELIVVRASGVSIARITGAVFKIGAVFLLAAIVLGEVISPWSESEAQRGRAQDLESSINHNRVYGFWMRDGHEVVNIREVLPDLSLSKIRIFDFDQDRRLIEVRLAEEGRHHQEGWRLYNIKKTTYLPHGGATEETFDETDWDTAITPQMMGAFMITPDQLSVRQLRRYITYLRANNQDLRPYELALWQKLSLPLSTAVMVILAIPFVFGSLRVAGGTGRNLFIGIIVGIFFYITNKAFGYIVLGYEAWPTFAGAMFPTAVLFIVALLMYRRVA